MKKLILFIAIAALCLTGFSGCGKDKDGGNNGEPVMVEITMENGGVIKLELYPDIAPITVENFVSLVEDEFYDGLIFHRIIKGFMIQGGAPREGDPAPKNIKGEFRLNGVDNTIKHVRGVISMARAQNYNSASSQFFIMHEDAPHLDGQYAAFGRVTEGMDVVDEIASVPTDFSDYPIVPQKIKTIRIISEDAE